MSTLTRDLANVDGLERGSAADLLGGLPVVTLGHDVATRFAGGLLSMLGAEVTRIEIADRGDLPAVLEDVRPAAAILGCEPDGRAIPADGLDFPGTIVRITPFDSTGPWAGLRGSDLIAAAAGGMAVVLGSPGRQPLRIALEQAEKQTGLTAASLVLAGATTGRPVRTTVGMTDVVAFYARTIGQLYLDLDLPWRRDGARSSGCAGWYPYSLLPAADGSMALICRSGAQWRRFVELLGHPAWADDPRYRDRARIAREYPEEVDELIAPWLLDRTRQEVMDACQAAGVPFFPVYRLDEAAQHEYPRRRDPEWAAFLDGERPDPPSPAVVWRRPGGSSSPPRDAAGPGVRDGDGVSDGPLAGVRVLDLGWVGVGPHVTLLLAELGATVIKVESASRMDYNRLVPVNEPEQYGIGPGVERRDAVPFFHTFNRGKLGLELELGHPEAARVLEPLTRWADVVVENFTAGVLARAALPVDRLLELNPRLVVASLSVAGQESPVMRGFAPTVLAAGGVQSLIGYEGEEPLGDLTYGLADYNGAQQGLLLILAALRAVERTGVGMYLDVSQIEGVLLLVSEGLRAAAGGDVPGPCGNRRPGHLPHDIYPTSEPDGWIAVDVPDDATWARFAACLAEPWCAEERWRTYDGRLAGRGELDEHVAAWTRRRSGWDAMALLQSAGVPAFPVLDFEDLEAGRHGGLAAADVDAGRLGHFPIAVAPWRTAGRRPIPTAAAPALGADSAWVLREICGLSDDEVSELRGAGLLHHSSSQPTR